MNFIVVLEPSRQQSDYGLSIRQDRQPSIIAFEGFDECLRDAVGFWRADCGKRVLRIMQANKLTLERHTGRRPGRTHDGEHPLVLRPSRRSSSRTRRSSSRTRVEDLDLAEITVRNNGSSRDCIALELPDWPGFHWVAWLISVRFRIHTCSYLLIVGRRWGGGRSLLPWRKAA